MLKKDSKNKGFKLVIVILTIVITIVLLTIELKLVYDSYIDGSGLGHKTTNIVDTKGLNKLLEKYQ